MCIRDRVEAAENSGSLITARLAMEQNREVWAVPGNITSRNSFGTNYLIKSAGAKLIQTWQDVVTEFPPDIAKKILPPPLKSTDDHLVKQLELVPRDLTEHELLIFQLLTSDTPSHIDSLAVQSKLSLPALTTALLGLEMKDLVRQLPGKAYVRKM
jgi:DNA processing protein